MLNRIAAAAAAIVLFALPAAAADVMVMDAYALSSNPKVAAAFMTIENHGDEDRWVVSVRTDVARTAELHTHIMEDGIAKMRPVDAIVAPAHGKAVLKRGGDHVMMMGVGEPLKEGDEFAITLVFDDGSEQVVELTVGDPGETGGMKHDMNHDMKKTGDDAAASGHDHSGGMTSSD